MFSQVFHRPTYDHVKKTITKKQFELKKLTQTFNTVVTKYKTGDTDKSTKNTARTES
jgi:hypothetical protein